VKVRLSVVALDITSVMDAVQIDPLSSATSTGAHVEFVYDETTEVGLETGTMVTAEYAPDEPVHGHARLGPIGRWRR
jgi:hypothetical protein